jgi:hypothetical protein
MPDEHKQMSKTSVILLVLYLAGAALMSTVLIYSLWSADSDTQAGPMPSPACAAAAPRVTNIYPMRLGAGAPQDIWLIGCAFPAGAQVKLNAAPHPAVLVDSNHIRVPLTAAETAAPVPLVLSVLTSAGAEIGSGSALVVNTSVRWQAGGRSAWIPRESQLFLLVLFMGLLGASVYALRSVANYRGDQMLYSTWLTYYVVHPPAGAVIALLLYLVVRAGFLKADGADVSTVNLFGICAVAGLGGMFSDIAFLKLRELFQVLFKPKDDRSDKLIPKITTTTLKDGIAGEDYEQQLQAENLTAPLSWSVSPDLPTGLTLDAKSGLITGKPIAVAARTSYEFTVTDSESPKRSTSAKLTLEVK